MKLSSPAALAWRLNLIRLALAAAGVNALIYMAGHESGGAPVLGAYSARLLIIMAGLGIATAGLIAATFHPAFRGWLASGDALGKLLLMAAFMPGLALTVSVINGLLPFEDLLYSAYGRWLLPALIIPLLISLDALAAHPWIGLPLAGLSVFSGWGATTRGDENYWPMLALIAAGLVIAALISARRLKHSPEAVQGLAVSLFALAFVLLGLEIGTRLLVAETNFFGTSLATRTWMRRYWHPINSLGYRDQEPDAEALAGRQLVLLVGDSFVAGIGVPQVEDRIPEQLAARLGDDYAVAVVAKPGWETPDQLAGLRAYPYQPDLIIICHFVNDIAKAAEAEGIEITGSLALPSERALIANSYMVNFVGLRLSELTFQPAQSDYFGRMAEAYNVAWPRHSADLAGFITYAEENDARLAVVTLPWITAPEQTTFATQPVTAFFEARGVPARDLSPLFAAADDPLSLAVSSRDAHTNAAANAIIAAEVYAFLADEGLISR